MRRLGKGKFHLTILVLLALSMVLSAFVAAVPTEARGPDGYVWTEHAGNPVFSGTGRAYYPRVIMVNGIYHMWYTDYVGGLYQCGYTTSADGITWASPTILTVGAGQPSHVVVVNVGSETEPHYRMWYGEVGTWPYNDSCFRTAESSDGLTWINDQAIGQDPSARLVQVPGSQWVYGSYGPGAVLYNPSGYGSLNTSDPMGNKYVMYYDQYTYPGSPTTEVTMLALSVDGINWSRWDNSPLPPMINASGGSTAWDAQYVYVWSVIKDGSTYHAWYSGGKSGSQDGIGYASSADGLNWTKDPQPLMHINDAGAPAWRNVRTYTPCVLQDGTGYKMWYTGVGEGLYRVGLATALAVPTIASVSPDQGVQGQTLSVAITGTHLSGTSLVSFGADITVNSFTVDSDAQITASVAISSSAAAGPRDVSVTTPGGTATKTGAFTVNEWTPDGWHERFTSSSSVNSVRAGHWVYQTFTPSTTHYFNMVSLCLQKTRCPTYTVTIGLYNVDPATHLPVGTTPLCSTTFAASSLTAIPTWKIYGFATNWRVVAGTEYALVLSGNGGDAATYVGVRMNPTGGYSGGSEGKSTNGGSTWVAFVPAQDVAFKEGQFSEPFGWYEQATVSNLANSVRAGHWVYQTFTPSAAHCLNSVWLNLLKVGSPGYTVTVALYGVDPVTHFPTTPLCSTTFAASSLTTTATWRTYSFTTGYEVVAGTEYALVLSGNGGDTAMYVAVRMNTAGGYSGGSEGKSTDGGSTWVAFVPAQDIAFKEGQT